MAVDSRNTSSLTNETLPRNVTEILELVGLSNIALLTLFGNSMVILAFIFGPRSIRTYTNYFVVNLAVSDLMVGCISLPFWILFRIDESFISDGIFNTLIPLDILSGITSILCLAAISLERMAAVKYTSEHFNLSKRPVIYAIIATWVIGFISAAPKYLANELSSVKIYTVLIFILGFLLPLSIIIASYIVIFYTASNMMTPTNEELTTAREMRVAKTISLIIGLFVICWTPFFTINMVYIFCRHCDRPKSLIYLSKVMHYSNSMMNFFVYSARSPDFSTFFKKVLCPKSFLSGRKKKKFIDGDVVSVSNKTTRFSVDNNNGNMTINNSHNQMKYTTSSEMLPFLTQTSATSDESNQIFGVKDTSLNDTSSEKNKCDVMLYNASNNMEGKLISESPP